MWTVWHWARDCKNHEEQAHLAEVYDEVPALLMAEFRMLNDAEELPESRKEVRTRIAEQRTPVTT